MNFNLSSILSSSLKFLNITKKALPLIKDLNPTVKTLKTKINEFKSSNKKEDIKELPMQKKEVKNNNSLTFFK